MSSKTEFKDVAIIGASLSGILAGYLLGRAGLQVIVVDPQEFPRHKPCGEGLSNLGITYLKAYDLWSRELQLSARPLYGYEIRFTQGNHLTLQAPVVGQPPLHSISRARLDAEIHRKVHDLKTVQILNERVRTIQQQAGRWTFQSETGAQVSARQLIIACGSRGPERLLPGVVGRPASDSKRYGIVYWCKGSWRGAPSSLVQIFQQEEGQYIITPLIDDSINVSILLNRQKHSSLRRKSILAKAAHFVSSAGFRTETFSPPLGASAIHSARLKSPPRSVYCIGDAVERFDPIGGMGMTHAVFSAALAAQTIISGDDAAAYYALRSSGARTLRMLTGLSYGLNVSLSHWQKRVASVFPDLTYTCMELIKQTFPAPPTIPARSGHTASPGMLPDHFQPVTLQE